MKQSLPAAIGASLLAAVLVHAADINVVKTGGAGKSLLDVSAIRVSGKGATTFISTLENDLKLSGWFQISAPGKGVLVSSGSAADSGSRLSVTIKVASQVSTNSV